MTSATNGSSRRWCANRTVPLTTIDASKNDFIATTRLMNELRNVPSVARACHETGLVLVWPPEQLGPACEEFILRHATSMENARQVA